MNPLLISLATDVGAPLVEKILAEKFGASTAALSRGVIDSIATKIGIPAVELPELAEVDPDSVRAAISEVETMAPELIALYSQGLEYQLTIAQQEGKGPLWTWAWRPAGMWGLGILWFWAMIGLHVLNAVCKTALPQPPYETLMALTALYLTLYMGGHTVKDVVRKIGSTKTEPPK